jgi:hypothetical protein
MFRAALQMPLNGYRTCRLVAMNMPLSEVVIISIAVFILI